MLKLSGLWTQRAPFKLVPGSFDMILGFDSFQRQTMAVRGVINRYSSKNGHFIQDSQILSLKQNTTGEGRREKKQNK